MTEELKNHEDVEELGRDLSFFMADNAEEAPEEKVYVSKRFKDKKGKVIPFIMKAIPTERIEELEKECTKTEYHKGRKIGERVDQVRFYARIAVETTIYPDLKSKELRKSYKTEDPIEVAKRLLSIGGEYSTWIEEATRINGFDDDFEDLEEEAKN
ncbi:phage portal protein [Heyndrickxia oleronia]|uniref:phage tail assembly chaperone n=1 Tax=Heyndrickxia oleronia TaxID=38875 RepID=UPI00203C224B|nr:phage portal protein [Heyndrickxia oleronia]MCM3452733.1 phage portal protein [Heyndrickxia oleronia]